MSISSFHTRLSLGLLSFGLDTRSTGLIFVSTGNSGMIGKSGTVSLLTGVSQNGLSGTLNFKSGSGVDGKGGNIVLQTGGGDFGNGGDIFFSAGATTKSGQRGGKVILMGGDGLHPDFRDGGNGGFISIAGGSARGSSTIDRGG